MAQKADGDPSFFQAAKPTFGFSPPKVMVKKIASVQVAILLNLGDAEYS